MQSTPTGILRITAPVLFGSTVLSGLVAEYMELYPQVNIDLVLSDQLLDLVQEGIDVAFRVGQLEDSSLIGRYLGDVKAMVCASPDYIAKFGKPNHPDEIENHQVLSATSWTQWSLKGPEGKEINVNIKPRLKVNDLSSLYTLALSGAGIAALPVLIAASAIKSKNLVPILCDWPFEAHPIHALYASNRHLSAKVRSFVDFVIERVRPNPPWLVDMEGHDKCEDNPTLD
jgi:DNA-binding transcriptional LysR family regulator